MLPDLGFQKQISQQEDSHGKGLANEERSEAPVELLEEVAADLVIEVAVGLLSQASHHEDLDSLHRCENDGLKEANVDTGDKFAKLDVVPKLRRQIILPELRQNNEERVAVEVLGDAPADAGYAASVETFSDAFFRYNL